MPFSLKHIAAWHALEIKTNGKNTSETYAKYLQFIESIPNRYQENDFTVLIPETYLDSFLAGFGFITTMTQTVNSIKGTEKPSLPKIDYEMQHLNKLKIEPYPFQKAGAAFLVSEKCGIIGDEMGLGKTLSGIASSNELLQQKLIQKVLVIPPASLKYQWKNEIEKFSDYQAIVIDGTAAKRKKQYALFQQGGFSFCVAGYETVRGDIAHIKTMDFDCVILDEAHRIKNRTTQIYKALIQLQPEYRFALTGTPMQNRPDEIFALMSWLDPAVLGKITSFRKEHVVIGEKFGRRFVDLGYKNLDTIREKISGKMIRRLKSEVAPDLPDILYSTVYCDMTKAQKTLYEAVSDDFRLLQLELQEAYAHQTEEEAKAGARAEGEQKILGYLYMMQAISDHPLLLAQGKSQMAKKYLPLIRECRTSPKLDELIEVLTPLIERGSNIIIFSKYTQMLHLMRGRIQKEFEQDPYMIYGDVPMKVRQEQMDDFEQNPNRQIMLLSDAGNAGWNISWADTSINYDLPWNPAIVDQRNGRIHRLNSTFDSVNIINMATNDTIDITIEETLKCKKELGDGLVERSDAEKELMKELLDQL